MTTTRTQYSFSYSRFSCGCAYRTTSDLTVACPTHRGMIVANDLVISDTPDIPDIPGLVLSRHPAKFPVVLGNSSSNSLHTLITVHDGRRNEWQDLQEDQIGLCCACFIDNGDLIETRIAACECGNLDCSYRWCGRLSGLHALWSVHVQGRHEIWQIDDIYTGQPKAVLDEDIFSRGPANELPQHVIQALDAERKSLAAAAQALVQQFQDHRAPRDYRPSEPMTPFDIPWLNPEYEAITDPNTDERELQHARASLERKLLRLHVAGVPIAPQPA